MSADDWFDDDREYEPLRSAQHAAGEQNAYALDCNGNRVYPGDYVKCEVGGYRNFKRGERRRVISVSMGTIVMRNGTSPTGTSAYHPGNFTLAGRHHAWHKSKEAQVAKNTLYVAVEIAAHDGDYETMVRRFNGLGTTTTALGCSQPGSSTTQGTGTVKLHSETSYEQLQTWLRQRIRANPDERWLILSGTVLAETSAPPVSFRQV